MIEVGLGVQYALSGVNKNGFFAGVGLSSNFMLREEYYYMFEDPSDSWASTYTNENGTLFNNVELNFWVQYICFQPISSVHDSLLRNSNSRDWAWKYNVGWGRSTLESDLGIKIEDLYKRN